jgi:predicted RNA-binding Zn-ribbon protein involved in translation (DUF1610 family)
MDLAWLPPFSQRNVASTMERTDIRPREEATTMPCPRCGNTDARCSPPKPNGWVWCSGVSDAPGWRRLGAGTGAAFYMPTAIVGQPTPAPVAFVGVNSSQAAPSQPPPAPTNAAPPQRTVPEENRLTRGLIRWLSRRGGKCTPRDLQRANARYRTRLTAEIALNNLVELGLVVKTRYRPPTGGHSVPVFTVPDDSIAQPTHGRFT